MTNFELNETLSKDCFEVAELPLCKVLMMNDQQYPWFILVPRVASVTEIYQLSPEQQLQLMQESNGFGKWLMKEFNGDKLNLGALGNMVPQLHIHHIVRYKSDPSWPNPVWGAKPTIPFEKNQAETRINMVRQYLSTL